MKTRSLLIAAVLTSAFAHATPSTAASLDRPMGMVTDSKGNLYVANFGSGGGGAPGGYVQIYDFNNNPITAFASGTSPTSVALTSSGNVYVTDTSTRTVRLYSPAYNYGQVRVITDQKNPTAIAVDGLDNLWIANQGATLVGGASNPLTTLPIYDIDGTLIDTGRPPSVTNALAIRGAFVALAQERGLESLRDLEILKNNLQHRYLSINSPVTAVSMDASGVEYVGTRDQQLYRCWPVSGACQWLRSVDYEPSGIAVDSDRGKFYVSSSQRSTVDIFQTDQAATFISTFH